MTATVSNKNENLKKLHDEDSKIVKGRFICHEPKGGSVKFSFRKYKEDPVKTYTLFDGKEYELPLAVVKHLNNCGWDVHSHLLDKDGNPYIGTGKRELRFTFQSVEFS